MGKLKIGQAKCPYCGYKTTTGGIRKHIKICPKRQDKPIEKVSTVKFEKYEVEPCECGHTVPLEFIVYDSEGCGTCLNCFRDLLVYKLEKEKSTSKNLRKKFKSLLLNK